MEKIDLRKNLETLRQCPFLSTASACLHGDVKLYTDDFKVFEIPMYVPCGTGDHVYFEIEKSNMTTGSAVFKIAQVLGISPRDVGVAGQKDARAVTRQMLSAEHVPPEKIEALSIPGIAVKSVSRHGNKLKMGHLRGNRFQIRLRNTQVDRIADAAQLLAYLEKNGAPNYFGMQRFGSRGDTGLVGRALIRGEHRQALELVLGLPEPELEGEAVTRARQLFMEEKYLEAADAWPRGFGENARLCRLFEKSGGHYKNTLMAVGKKMLTFYVSAYQSILFNQVLAARIQDGTVTQMLEGDIAWKHDKGVCFQVTDAALDTQRAQSGEISPTGPLFGAKMKWPDGVPGDRERHLLADEGVTIDQFSRRGPFKSVGGRRPLRIFPSETSVTSGGDDRGEFLQFEFTLPSGAYATEILREICKSDMSDAEEK